MSGPLSGQSTDANVPGVLGDNTAANGPSAGIFGRSQAGEGVHGETSSPTFGAVAGIQLNPNGTGGGVYGENRGKGHGVFGKSQNWLHSHNC